jgi:hypothetical protein
MYLGPIFHFLTAHLAINITQDVFLHGDQASGKTGEVIPLSVVLILTVSFETLAIAIERMDVLVVSNRQKLI